jgi:cytochrome c oxidase subunit 1
MPRRIYTYPSGRGWDVWNLVSTIGSFTIALGILVFIINLWVTRKSPNVGNDPWDARTLEWTVPSPPPEYNFAEIPLVTSRDELWHQKYSEDEHGRPVRRETPDPLPTMSGTEVDKAPPEGHEGPDVVGDDGSAGHAGDHEGGHQADHDEPHIHMPSPSYWPLFTSLGLPIIAYGMMYKTWAVAILGGVWTLGGLYSWALEPATAPEEPEEPEPAAELEEVPA